MFFVMPLIFVGTSFIDQENGIGTYVTLALILIILIPVIIINSLQGKMFIIKNIKVMLPEILQTWEFLPLWARSLEPYDR